MLARVTKPGNPAFRLRKGEEGISVFDLEAVEPMLTEEEILNCFHSGSQIVFVSLAEITRTGLQVIPIQGGEPLPPRLKTAHAEIRPGKRMSRSQFKHALRELE